MDSMPEELDALTRRIMQLEIEEAAMMQETDDASKTRLKTLRKEVADLKEQETAQRQQWQNEKASISELQELRGSIEATKAEIERVERAYDLNKAAELKHGKLPQLEARLADAEANQSESSLVKEEVKGWKRALR